MSLCFDVQLKIITHHSPLQFPENPNTTPQISSMLSWVFIKISGLAPSHSSKQEHIHTSIVSTGPITLFCKLCKKCCRFELLCLKERFAAVVRGSETHCTLFTLNLTCSPQTSVTTLTITSICSTLPHVIHITHTHIATPAMTKSSTCLSPNTNLAMITTTLWCGLTTFLQALSYNIRKNPFFYIDNT